VLKRNTYNTLSRDPPQVEVHWAQRGSCLVLLLPSFFPSDSPWVRTDNVSSGLWSYPFDPSSGDLDLSRTYAEYREYRVPNARSCKHLRVMESFVRRDFNLSRNNRKEESFSIVFVVGRARNDSWGCVWCICVYVYVRERSLAVERERDRRAVEEEEKSFLRTRENFERPCVCFSSFFLIFFLRRRRQRRHWTEIVRLD